MIRRVVHLAVAKSSLLWNYQIVKLWNYQILQKCIYSARRWRKFRFKYGRNSDYFSHFWTGCSASEMKYQLSCPSADGLLLPEQGHFSLIALVSAYSGNRLNRSCLPLQGGAEEGQAACRFGEILRRFITRDSSSLLTPFCSSSFPLYFQMVKDYFIPYTWQNISWPQIGLKIQPLKPRCRDIDDVCMYQCGGLRMFVSGVEENQVVV